MSSARHLYDLIDPLHPEAVEREVLDTLAEIEPRFAAARVRRLYRDVVALFQGRYPGYRASDAWYHDLEHTNTVLLCLVAMLHGAHYDGVALSGRSRLLAIAGALFHDVGLIRRLEEHGGTGARYTIGHEQRSIAAMTRYFAEHGFSTDDAVDTGHIILCTALGQRLDEIPFRHDEIRLAGQMLGSADVVAQMADRAYLEKLLLLFREFREAGIPGYDSELELLEKTPAFYDQVVKRRLDGELDHADAFLASHARRRWGVDEEPFHQAIEHNLRYLDDILRHDKGHYREHLRRRGIAATLPHIDQQGRERG